MISRQHYLGGAVAGLIGAACCSTSALAADGWYLGGAIGANFEDSENFNGDNGSFQAGYSNSAVYGVHAGYALPSGLRPEFAIDLRSNDANSLSSNGNSTSTVTGKEEATSYMANVWYDVRLPQRDWRQIHPYLGGGLGFAQVGVHGLSQANLAQFSAVDDDQTVLAYQFGMGVGYDITPRWLVSADFRYLATSSADFKYTAPAPALGGTVNAGYSAESLMVSVRYQFGRNLFR
jgi:opacity protein-like surface antigen